MWPLQHKIRGLCVRVLGGLCRTAEPIEIPFGLAGLFSKEKISKGGLRDEYGKSEENRISGEAYDVKARKQQKKDKSERKADCL